MDISDLLIQFVTALGGTFVGAWAAFQLNIHENKKKIEDEPVAAANRALFIMLSRLNMLTDIKRKFIDPVIDDPARLVNMNALPPLQNPAPRLDIQALDFLLETNYRQLLLDLEIEEQRYQEAIQALNLRSTFHHQTVQPLLAQAGISTDASCPLAHIYMALGPFVAASLTNATDSVIFHVESTCKSLEATLKKATDQFKLIFP